MAKDLSNKSLDPCSMKNRILTIVLTSILALGISPCANAQPYRTAAGLNFGPAIGASVKHFVGRRAAIETALSYNFVQYSPMLSAVYQYHSPLGGRFFFYSGIGLDLGFIDVDEDSRFAIGTSPTVGFEYVLGNVPIAIALDYKPVINFNCRSLWEEVAFKVRYRF